MVEVRVNFPLDDNEVKRIFNALDLRYDTKHALVFGKYCNNEFMRDETMVAETISQYVSGLTSLLQRLCKPPNWCKIKTLVWRF